MPLTEKQQSCYDFLSHGDWVLKDEIIEKLKQETKESKLFEANLIKFMYNPNVTQGVTFFENNYMTWIPKTSCKYKIYTPQEMRECFSTKYNSVQILGDSRGRQMWAAFNSLLLGREDPEAIFRMQDGYLNFHNFLNDTNFEEDPKSTGIMVNHEFVRYPSFSKDFMLRRYGNPKHIRVYGQPQPKLVIINAMVLHAFKKEQMPEAAENFHNETYPGPPYFLHYLDHLHLWNHKVSCGIS